MATTTNYSWSTPDDTALVKDGAAAIRSLGTAIDTTVFTNAGAAIPKSLVDAAGDLLIGTADNTVGKLAIGTASQQLRVNSGATSLEYFTPAASGGMTLLTTMSLSGSSVTSSSFSSSYKALKIYVKNVIASTGAQFYLRLNGDTGANYSYRLLTNDTSDSNFGAANEIRFGNTTSQSDPNLTNYAIIDLMTPSDTDSVFIKSVCSEGTGPTLWQMAGVYDNAAAITSVTLFPGSGTFTSGSALIYGVN